MGKNHWDFSGWATRFDRKCSDGRTIRDGAFDEDDGNTVPLVWQHDHDSPDNVLGHALLETRPGEGIYAYCSFNNTERAQNAKESVIHGDITSLSIHANRLKQSKYGDVLHGRIREVSLVLTGANPDAKIDQPFIMHSDDYDDEAIIFAGEDLELYHADSDDKDDEDKKRATDEKDSKPKSLQDVFDTLNEEQKAMVYAMIDMAVATGDDDESDEEDEKEEVKHADNDTLNTFEGGNDMKRNVFDQDVAEKVTAPSYTLSHADVESILHNAKKAGSLKEAWQDFANDVLENTLSHDDETPTYGIKDVDWLFPEARLLNSPPDFIKRETGWVSDVMSKVHHTPFSRIKSMFADITKDEARAKGYTKGNRKTEEVFELLKRETTPTTVYKKQKMDRDDILDITDFDVVAWLKSEMRMMLDEELARAYLVSDGRSSLSPDKIKESNIRPIWTDDDLFTIKQVVRVAADADNDTIARQMIRDITYSRKNYKGSGNPTFYTTEDVVTDMLLLEDGVGRRLYKDVNELATTLRVSKIVTVPVMEGLTRTVSTDNGNETRSLLGIIVNLTDYNVGADKGGAVAMFEDFDIDYNQEKYLIETRCSGALIKPYSAIAVEMVKAAS